MGIFSKRVEIASIGTMGSEQISSNYKNNDENKKYFLPFDELAAPFFGEKESIISVKNKIQFVFNLFVDTIKKQKKKQFVSLSVFWNYTQTKKTSFFKQNNYHPILIV